jgi:3-deoxy-D-arabino-heptulosonate 7-phosphate (DAHP) synthase
MIQMQVVVDISEDTGKGRIDINVLRREDATETEGLFIDVFETQYRALLDHVIGEFRAEGFTLDEHQEINKDGGRVDRLADGGEQQ